MKCKICLSNRFKELYYIKDLKYKVTGKIFLVKKCLECSVYIISENGEAITDLYYPENYDAFIDINKERDQVIRIFPWHVVQGRMAWIRKIFLTKNTAILDIGCGCGVQMALIRNMFHSQVYGIEPNENAVRAAEKKGFKIHCGTLENFHSDFTFDIIYLSHVLEHMFDPFATLNTIFKLITPGGKVIIATPNINSLERIIFRKYWDGWDTPRHIYMFNPQLLRNTLKKIGFEDIKIYYEIYSLFSRSLYNLIGNRRNKVINIIARYINFILSYFLPFIHFSGAIQIIAKKQ